jgi:metallo-beta-lactamase family protein
MSGKSANVSSSGIPRVRFLGAAGTVTGSRFLFEWDEDSILVDCGLYQGLKALRLRNWHPWPFALERLKAVALTHAHIDHSGYLPRLYRLGYRGPVHCTTGTEALLRILLPDAAHLQVEEAEYANRHGYSKHHPAEPLFDDADAEGALKLLCPVDYGRDIKLGEGRLVRFVPAGHLLGAASVLLTFGDGSRKRRILVSGDLGRYGDDFMAAPHPPNEAVDYLLVESTYGNRRHPGGDLDRQFAAIVNETFSRNGMLLIPAFAVGRTQELLFRLARIEREGLIPTCAVYVDSPMAVEATEIYRRFAQDLSFDWAKSGARLATRNCRFVRATEDSKALHSVTGNAIIISASGMATGGRILHHLRRRLGDDRNTVLFAGYQVDGTRGRKLIDGAKSIKLLGEEVDVRARIENFRGASAHGDREDLLRWVGSLATVPRRTFVVHGEPLAAGQLRDALDERLGHDATVAELDGVVRLT